VVGEKGRVLVAALAGPLEPLCEASMKVRPRRLRQGGVGHLARQRVFDRVLTLAGDRRAASAADEVALLEQREVGSCALEQLLDRTGPEDATDDGGRLEGRLFCRRQEVDARGEHGLNRVRGAEIRRERAHRPGSVVALEHSLIDERT
jgi:hypothetical protein